MFLFSRKLIQDSLKTRKAPAHKLKLVHWGPDLPFYDHLLAEMPDRKPEGFISTGKENRDVSTLFQAFAATKEKLDLYIAVSCGNINYKNIIDGFTLPCTLHRRSNPLRACQTGGAEKLYCHLLSGFSLYRRAHHTRRSICSRHSRHLFA